MRRAERAIIIGFMLASLALTAWLFHAINKPPKHWKPGVFCYDPGQSPDDNLCEYKMRSAASRNGQ